MCGSIWSCAVCSANIRNHRAEEIAARPARRVGRLLNTEIKATLEEQESRPSWWPSKGGEVNVKLPGVGASLGVAAVALLLAGILWPALVTVLAGWLFLQASLWRA